MPLRSSLSETSPSASHSLPYKPSLERPQERGVNNIKPASFSTSPKPISPSALQSSYPAQSSYRDYPKQKSSSSVGSYSKHYEPNIPPTTHNYDMVLPPNIPYHKSKHPPQSSLSESREPDNHHEPHVMNHQQMLEIPHNSLYSDSRDNHKTINDAQVKEPTWSIKTNPEDSPDTPVTFLPYQIDTNKEMPSPSMSESSRYPVRPPSVIEIIEENSRDTKTYIQLEVPKNSHREKIVVVDVENDEINKDCDLPSNNNKTPYDISQEKTVTNQKEEISHISDTKKDESTNIVVDVDTKCPQNKCTDNSKESPDIMVIEVKKKKESAVVRRARLHGKQRTFRDAYNRPLVPLSKVKKSESSASEESGSKPVATEIVLPPPLPPPKPSERKFPHGWSWEGQTFEKQVYVSVSMQLR